MNGLEKKVPERVKSKRSRKRQSPEGLEEHMLQESNEDQSLNPRGAERRDSSPKMDPKKVSFKRRERRYICVHSGSREGVFIVYPVSNEDT